MSTHNNVLAWETWVSWKGAKSNVNEYVALVMYSVLWIPVVTVWSEAHCRTQRRCLQGEQWEGKPWRWWLKATWRSSTTAHSSVAKTRCMTSKVAITSRIVTSVVTSTSSWAMANLITRYLAHFHKSFYPLLLHHHALNSHFPADWIHPMIPELLDWTYTEFLVFFEVAELLPGRDCGPQQRLLDGPEEVERRRWLGVRLLEVRGGWQWASVLGSCLGTFLTRRLHQHLVCRCHPPRGMVWLGWYKPSRVRSWIPSLTLIILSSSPS